MSIETHAFPKLIVNRREGTVAGPGGRVRLEPKVMKVLAALARHPGRVVSSDELLDAAWPGAVVTEQALTRCINQLRNELGKIDREPGQAQCNPIETLPKQGYRLLAPIETSAAEDSPDAVSPRNGTRVSQLPALPTPLVGRAREVEAARRLLLRQDVRLVTFTGPGGTGKTRLALQVARELTDSFPDRAYFVELAPIRDAELVLTAITDVFQLKESPGRSLLDNLRAYLQNKQLLLVLDNFEHLLEAASQVVRLLEGSPRLKVLVTSRAPLHVRGEHQFDVPPLGFPAAGSLPSLDRLAEHDAVTLFVQRAQAVKPSFVLSEDNAISVVEICRKLDGVPLALELAAARAKLFPPESLLTRLEDSLAFLTAGARDLPARQQTLRDTIRWSYQLLDECDQVLFRRLAVFVGGFTLEAAEAVGASVQCPACDILDGLETLIDNSLLRVRAGGGGEPRFEMLETIRQFGAELLRAKGEDETARERSVAYLISLAERAEPELTGPEQPIWFQRLDEDYNNLRSALEWLDSAGSKEDAMRLAGALWRFWWVRGHPREGREWLEWALSSAHDVPAALRAKALLGAGSLAARQYDADDAEQHCTASLALFRDLGDKRGMAASLWTLGFGLNAQAKAYQEESLALANEIGDHFLVAHALNELGEIARTAGDLDRAEDFYRECLAANDALDARDSRIEGVASYNLGVVAYAREDYETAREFFGANLRVANVLGDKHSLGYALSGLAGIWAKSGDPVRAVQLFAKSEALLEENGTAIEPADRAHYDRSLAAARAAVDGKTFSAAWERGQRRTNEEACSLAVGEEFVTGTHRIPAPDRILATVLFTDIVDSTQHATELGDRRWRALLDNHNAIMRREIGHAGGRVVKSTGDGVLATFDEPGRAIACACTVREIVKSLGIEIRTGLHSGEIDLMGDDVGGIAVHIAARVSALAGASEVLVSSTVKDLVAGAGFRFADRGVHTLKGVAEEWRLFGVVT